MKLKKTMIQGQMCYIPCEDEDEQEDVIVVDDDHDLRSDEREAGVEADDISMNAGHYVERTVSKDLGWNSRNSHARVQTSMIYQMLPFMDNEELAWLTRQILEGKEEYASLSLVALMPFLSDEDCDAVFMKAVEQHQQLEDLLPFVSDQCLHELVQQYMSGEAIGCDVNQLYPFLSNADLKELFHYELKKEIRSQ